MIINQGVDIIENKRVERIINLYKQRFLRKIFSLDEINKGQLNKNIFSQKMIQKYSARFAAKEAASKALGYGISKGIKFSEIEIFSNFDGMPFIKFNGSANKRLKKLQKTNKTANVNISMSHEKKYSIAIVTISE